MPNIEQYYELLKNDRFEWSHALEVINNVAKSKLTSEIEKHQNIILSSYKGNKKVKDNIEELQAGYIHMAYEETMDKYEDNVYYHREDEPTNEKIFNAVYNAAYEDEYEYAYEIAEGEAYKEGYEDGKEIGRDRAYNQF